MAQPEDMSPETAMLELAEILASGFLRLRGRVAALGENQAGIKCNSDVTVNMANGYG